MQSPKINVTPLIDVLLVLLIIFMVVAPLKPARFQMKIPASPDSHRPLATSTEALVVTLGADLKLALNNERSLGTPNDPGALIAKLKSTIRQREANGMIDDNGNVIKTVFIKAPRSIEYGNVVKVIDAVKTAGAEPMALQVDFLE